jgi:hypothetical protein
VRTGGLSFRARLTVRIGARHIRVEHPVLGADLPTCCGDFLFENTFVVRVKLATVWQMTHEQNVAGRSQTILLIDAKAL